MKPLSILVADDEKSIQELLELELTRLGHRVVTASDVNAGLKAIKDHRFDLLVTDMLMPGGGGGDLIAALKKTQPTARIVAMSGGGRYANGEDCLGLARGLGAHALVLKPFTFSQLRAGIATALTGRSVAP
jgi:CheY-like chemotaxis protein